MQPQVMYYLINIQSINQCTGYTEVFVASRNIFVSLQTSSEPYKKPWHSQEKNVTPINILKSWQVYFFHMSDNLHVATIRFFVTPW